MNRSLQKLLAAIILSSVFSCAHYDEKVAIGMNDNSRNISSVNPIIECVEVNIPKLNITEKLCRNDQLVSYIKPSERVNIDALTSPYNTVWFYVLKPGVCTWDKKYCVGDSFKNDDIVAGVLLYNKLSDYRNNDELSKHGLLLKNTKTGLYKKYSDDHPQLEKNIKYSMKLLNKPSSKKCYKEAIYEGDLVDYDDSLNVENKSLKNDGTGKCSLVNERYFFQNVELTEENLQDKNNYFYPTQFFWNDSQSFGYRRRELPIPVKAENAHLLVSNFRHADENTDTLKINYDLKISSDNITKLPLNYNFHYKVKSATSIYKFVPLKTTTNVKYRCENLKKVEVDFCHSRMYLKEDDEFLKNGYKNKIDIAEFQPYADEGTVPYIVGIDGGLKYIDKLGKRLGYFSIDWLK